MVDAPDSVAALAAYTRHMEDRVRLPSSEQSLLGLHAEAKAAALALIVGVPGELTLVREVMDALEKYSEGWEAEGEAGDLAEGGSTPCVQRKRLTGGLLYTHWVANVAASLTHCRRLMDSMSQPVLARVTDGAFGQVAEVNITPTYSAPILSSHLH
jgi:hypothetical protein